MRLQALLPLVLVSLLGACATAGAGVGPSPAAPPPSPLLTPASPEMTAFAPARYKALFETSQGDFIIEVQREWAPRGADRFYNLVRHGFYDDARFFRALPDFVVQFGISGDPQTTQAMDTARIQDDPVSETNSRGTITFAAAGPNTRTTQVFINLADNSRLDPMGFAAFGRVVGGMDIVDGLYSGYGEGAPMGRGPDQNRIKAEGTPYLQQSFPELDYVYRARILPD